MTEDTLTHLSRAMIAGDAVPFDHMPAAARFEIRLWVHQVLVALRTLDSRALEDALAEPVCCPRCTWEAALDALIAEGCGPAEAVH